MISHGSLTGGTVHDEDLGDDFQEIAVTHKGNVSNIVYFTAGWGITDPDTSPVVGVTLLPGTRRIVRVAASRGDADRAGNTHVKMVSAGAVDWEIEAPVSHMEGPGVSSAGEGGDGLTNTELRAAPVPVSSATLATAANQSTANSSLSSLETKVGEVQASPTANTLLARLKTIADAVTGALTVATHAVTQSGTWTVQPGNTANTTAWKVDGSAVTQPVSGTVTANAGSGTQAVSLASVPSHAVTNAGTFATQAVAAGDVAHDGADAGNPVKVGAKATSSEPAAVATGDRTNLITDLVGKLITAPYTNPENIVSGAITSAMTGTTTTSLLAAPAAGLRNYITTIIVSNAHATVGTDIVIQDGSGGTTLLTIPAAAVYGGAVINLPVPLRQPTTATAIFCANVTTGASTKVSAVGYKGV